MAESPDSPVPTPYLVRCQGACGDKFLSRTEYLRQLAKPDQGWRCPICQGPAEWNDANWEMWMLKEAGEDQ